MIQANKVENDFLFEIGTEELPPRALHNLSVVLGNNIEQLLVAANLQYGQVKLFATPRRLAVLIKDLINKQEDRIVEHRGPYVSIAFTPNGQATTACLGFAKAHGVNVEDLERTTDGKDTCIMVKKVQIGEKTQNLLPNIVNKALKNLPIPRQMRWGTGNITFARPVHWVLMVYGNEVVNSTVLGVAASNLTYGHRFHSPGAITIADTNQYEQILAVEGYVIADFQKRRELIVNLANQAMQHIGDNIGNVLIDNDLLEEVTSITEWPVALLCRFNKRFLQLPSEVLILTLQKQQRCFPVADKSGKLQPYFIAISNIDSKQPACVIKGNENVILARLVDAEFFYKSDTKYLLDSYFDKLQRTVFQTGIGSMYDKTQRLIELAGHIAEVINADIAATKRAAELSKSDLMTTMVGEFPELQGIIGYYYAVDGKESIATATALREQYLPAFAKDCLPTTLESCALAIADRIDNIVGVFSLGKEPTGDGDPFGLRRAAFAILRIILEKKLDLNVFDLMRRSLQKYLQQIDKFDELLFKNYQASSTEHGKTVANVANKVLYKIMDFIFERQRSWYLEAGISNNVFDAVRMCQPAVTRPVDFDKRLHAVEYFCTLAEALELSAAHKRVKNILINALPSNTATDTPETAAARSTIGYKTLDNFTVNADLVDFNLSSKSTEAIEAEYEQIEAEAKKMLRSLKKKLHDIQLVAKDFIQYTTKLDANTAKKIELTMVYENQQSEIAPPPNEKLFVTDAEKELAAKISQTTVIVNDLCLNAKYEEALKEMALLKTSIDYFFNNVMVMVEDEKLRHNRLLLLKQLRDLFYKVADISYLTVSK